MVEGRSQPEPTSKRLAQALVFEASAGGQTATALPAGSTAILGLRAFPSLDSRRVGPSHPTPGTYRFAQMSLIGSFHSFHTTKAFPAGVLVDWVKLFRR